MQNVKEQFKSWIKTGNAIKYKYNTVFITIYGTMI